MGSTTRINVSESTCKQTPQPSCSAGYFPQKATHPRGEPRTISPPHPRTWRATVSRTSRHPAPLHPAQTGAWTNARPWPSRRRHANERINNWRREPKRIICSGRRPKRRRRRRKPGINTSRTGPKQPGTLRRRRGGPRRSQRQRRKRDLAEEAADGGAAVAGPVRPSKGVVSSRWSRRCGDFCF